MTNIVVDVVNAINIIDSIDFVCGRAKFDVDNAKNCWRRCWISCSGKLVN